MAKKKAPEDKAVRPGEDKLARDLATLTRDATFDGPSHGGDHKTTVCYNGGCPDYGVARTGDGPCSCRRTSVDRR